MELILLIGLQGSGKSTFCKQKFSDTHLRLNLDMLRTRSREQILFAASLKAKQPVIIDNTNPTPGDRERYIAPAKTAKFKIIGYYFQSSLEDCRRRNELRRARQVVPLVGLLSTYSRLVMPDVSEGFDVLWYVRIADGGEFVIEKWNTEEQRNEVR